MYLLPFKHRLSALPDIDALAALPTLTVVLLLLNAPDIWYLSIPLIALGVVGLALPQLARGTPYWFAMATLLGATVYFNWEMADNHQYLFVYWCMALFAAFSLPRAEQAEALALSSRWLLGLCMLLATLWKAFTPQYVDGTFFEFSLLADDRFADVARWLGGATARDLADNCELVGVLTDGYVRGMEVDTVRLAAGNAIAPLTSVFTWWTIGIEGLLGALFLLPDRWRLARLRNAALVLFAVTTYSVAHVRGFGWMLMLLGLAQCRPEEKHWRWAYLAALVLIQLYLFPLAALVEALAT